METKYESDAVENYCIARKKQFDTIGNGAILIVLFVMLFATTSLVI